MDDIKGIVEFCKTFSESVTSSFVDSVREGLHSFVVEFQKQITNSLPTDDERQQIIESLAQWGKFGWSLIDFAPIDLYSNTPASVSEADTLALQYCTDDEIQHLIEGMQNAVEEHSDFSEAVFCYNSNQYKACALLLFALIDSRIIKLQPGDGWKQTGYKGADKLKTGIEKNDNTKNYLTRGSEMATLYAILALYKGADNFIYENPDLINRNFVTHGMSNREVSKTDCIKLLITLDKMNTLFNKYHTV